MSQEQIVFTLDMLRKEYLTMMQSLEKFPCDLARKQQAFYRFEEGHMWMQNAIINYVAPEATPKNEKEDALCESNVAVNEATPAEHE